MFNSVICKYVDTARGHVPVSIIINKYPKNYDRSI